ncbi:MAG: hypothetical protein RKO24_17420 [Candidatus Competibacter sp.]|nr:hypothetical protein [Candidatus Competibacter sp.]
MKADEYLNLISSGHVDMNRVRSVLYEVLQQNEVLRRDLTKVNRRLRELENKSRLQASQLNDCRMKLNLHSQEFRAFDDYMASF